jgi:ribosomal protein L37E
MNVIDIILWWACLPLAGLLIGAVLLRFGLRAKVLDDHPVCRRCGYDLFGAAPGSSVCPECGADVTGKRAARIGRRERRPAVVGVAVVLLVASLAGLGVLGRRAAVAWRDDANKPVWWLARQLERKELGAFAELNRRFRAGLLSPAQVEWAARGVLVVQGDHGIAWDPQWGDFVEAARAQGQLPDDLWRRYAEQAVCLTLINRAVVRRGEPMPIQFKEGPSRLGRTASLFTLEYKARQVTVDGRPVNERLYWEHMDQMSASGWGSMTQTLPLGAPLAELKDGPHRVQAVFDVEVYPRSNRPHRVPPVAKFMQVKRLDWTLAARDAETVELLRDAASQALVEKKVRVDLVEHRKAGVQVSLAVDGLPFDLAYDVVLRAGGREWKVGQGTMDANSGGGSGAFGRVGGEFTLRSVDVVLRGSADAARTTPHMTKVWGGEVVFRDVPVRREP